jgi:hypothetical protein
MATTIQQKFNIVRFMLNFCGIVAAILNMATGRNCSMSGINSGHHYLATYKILMIWPFSKWPPHYRKNSTLSDIIKISYQGRLWCPELIPDIEKILPVDWLISINLIGQHQFLKLDISNDSKQSNWLRKNECNFKILTHQIVCWLPMFVRKTASVWFTDLSLPRAW